MSDVDDGRRVCPNCGQLVETSGSSVQAIKHLAMHNVVPTGEPCSMSMRRRSEYISPNAPKWVVWRGGL